MKSLLHFLQLSLIAVLLLAVAGIASAQSGPPTQVNAMHLSVRGGLSFIENRGQIVDTKGKDRPDVLYVTEANGVRQYLTRQGVSYVFDQYEKRTPTGGEDPRDVSPYKWVGGYRMDMQLVGSNPSAVVTASEQNTDYTNYYYQNHPEGLTHVHSYRQVLYSEIYPHIDMVVRCSQQLGVKTEFIVHPGGKVSDIRMRYVASDHQSITSEGALYASNSLGYVEENAPYSYVSYGVSANSQKPVVSNYVLADGDVRFTVSDYDHSQTLVIDPVRKWSTYYGGSGNEVMNGGDPTEVDRSGNVIVTGISTNNAYPTTVGAYQTSFAGGNEDAVLVKFNGQGVRQWATYYGGSNDDRAHGVVSDSARSIYIAGHTFSSNFPTGATNGNQVYQSTFGGGFGTDARDGFIVKFDQTGARQWGTYYGGNSFDDAYGFALDSAYNPCVGVTTKSPGLNTSNGYSKPAGGSHDINVTKFDPTGGRIWSTYWGGTAEEYAYAIGSDKRGNVIITGYTAGSFPTTSGAAQTTYGGGSYDAYVVKFNTAGTLLWSTYLGGSGTETQDNGAIAFCGVATDGQNNVFVCGQTNSSNFPVTTGARQTTLAGSRDAFIAKYDSNGNKIWATYFGGSGDETGAGCASNPDGEVLLTGGTSSTNFPVTADAEFSSNAGSQDAYLVKLSATGALVYSSYLGGSSGDTGEGISFDPHGSLIIAGNTNSTNFPTLGNPTVAQGTKGGTGTGTSDFFIALYCYPSKPPIDSSGALTFCPGDSVTLSTIDGYTSYRWNTNNPADTNSSLLIKTSGTYHVDVASPSGCTARSLDMTVNVYTKVKPNVIPAGPVNLCQGDSIQLVAPSNYVNYVWSTGETGLRGITVKTAGTYFVRTIDTHGCFDTSNSVVVNVFPKPQPVSITPVGPITVCAGSIVTLTASNNPDTYHWTSGETSQTIHPTQSGTYHVTVTNAGGCSVVSNDVVVKINPKPAVQIFPSGATQLCDGDSVSLLATPGYVQYKWSHGPTSPSVTVKQTGDYMVTVTDTNGCTNTSTISVTVSPKPHPTINKHGPVIFCKGDSVVLDAGSYSRYQWSTGQISSSITVRDSGSYYVTVTDPSGCQGVSDTVVVQVHQSPHATISGATEVCVNSTSQYSVQARAGTTYKWSVTGGGGSITSGAGTDKIAVQWGGSGIGKVTATVTDDVTGCSNDTTITVIIGNNLKPSVTTNRSTALCPGDSITLDAGTGYATYDWSNGAKGQKITIGTPGAYFVSVASAQGCSGTSDTVHVTANTPPVPAITVNGRNAICPGDTVSLTVAGKYASYEWSNGYKTPTIIVNAPGDYSVTVTDSAGCTGTSQKVTITSQAPPVPVIDGPNSVCINSKETYCAPDSAGSTYDWTVTNGTIVSGQGTKCVVVQWNTGATNGSLTVKQIMGGTGCSGTSVAYPVTMGSALTPTIVPSGSTSLCPGNSVTLSAPAGYAIYQWRSGETTRSITVNKAGVYTVSVTDSGGCFGSGDITVTVNPPVLPNVGPTGPLSLCEGDSVLLTADPGYVLYKWSTGDSSQSIYVKKDGNYSVSVTDANGCIGGSPSVQVTVHPIPPIPTITKNATGDTLTASAGSAYQWYLDSVAIPGGTKQKQFANKIGAYTVRVTDQYGCSSESLPIGGALASAAFALPVIDAKPGDHIQVPMTLSTSQNLDAVGAKNFTAVLRFNNSVLLPEGPTPIGVVTGRDRVVTLTGARSSGTVTGEVATLHFIVALGDTLTTTIHLDSLYFTDALVSTSMSDGQVNVKPSGGWHVYVPGTTLDLSPARPNPATDGKPVNFDYNIIEPGRTQVYVTDVVGRKVADVVDASLKPGKQIVTIDVSNYASGVYYCVLQTPSARLVQQFQVIH